MKKVENINIGGTPFLIDEDAYVELFKYLTTIESHFSSSEGCEEIVEDIEFRLAELFNDQIKPRKIISQKDLDKIISIMGTPEDFGASAPIFDEPETEARSERTGSKRHRPRRLFRDGEDKVVAGVASGLTAYFGLDDPLFIRILFSVLIFTGVGALPYILLWIIVPKAKTASDRLAMTGKPINIENIAKQVEDELVTLKDKVQDLGKNFGKKK